MLKNQLDVGLQSSALEDEHDCAMHEGGLVMPESNARATTRPTSGLRLRPQGLQAPPPGLPMDPQGLPVESQGLPMEPQGLPAELPGLRVELQSLPAESPGLRVESQGLRVESQGLSNGMERAAALTPRRVGAEAVAAIVGMTRRVKRVLSIEYLESRGIIPFANRGRQLLRSYSRIQQAEATVLEPRTVEELVKFFQQMRAQRESAENDENARLPYCTFRAGGHSFHDQALNDEVIISLSKLNHEVKVDKERQLAVVGPCVTWGDLVKETLKHQLLPHVVVTTSKATVAGTLASDGICRHSPIYGSESGHVEWLDVLTPIDDEPRRLRRPEADDDSDEAQLFRAVIGGFGYLGVITQICYRLLSVAGVAGPADAPLRVKTKLRQRGSFTEIVNEQLELTAAQAQHRDDLTDRASRLWLDDWEGVNAAKAEHKAIYSIAFLGPDRDLDGMGAVYESWYERAHKCKPYVVYHRRSLWRFALELMASVSWIRRLGAKAMWWSIKRHSKKGTVFVDDVEDYLFFMDVNRSAKKLIEKFGCAMPVIQQTYVVPPEETATFLEQASAEMKRLNVRPTLLDVLFMPRDRILMSASYHQEGFACSMAFEDVRKPDKREAVVTLLKYLTRLCGELGGRVHFTKHVYADPEELCAMYGSQAQQFMRLKRRYDPNELLHNRFFERVFIGSCEHSAAAVAE